MVVGMVTGMGDWVAKARYASRLPPSMVFGRLRQGITKRYVVPRVWSRWQPRSSDTDPRSVLRNVALRAFADAYAVAGDRFSDTVSSLDEGVFIANEQRHELPPPACMVWGGQAVVPAMTRWEHDLAYFNYSIPYLEQFQGPALSTISAMLSSLERQADHDEGDLRAFHWSPIALATRIMSLSVALTRLRPEVVDEQRGEVQVVLEHVLRCRALLSQLVERYLGYNHAVFTEMGWLVSCLVAGEQEEAETAAERIIDTIDRCVLDDGLWSERSPAYHVHMLLLLTSLRASGILPAARQQQAISLLDRMQAALVAVVHVDGEIAIFNDAALGDAVSPDKVGWARPTAPYDLLLEDAGFFHAGQQKISVIMDAGPLGPRDVSGHGHADFLSLEVCVHGHRFIVDPGVSSVSPGVERTRTRSARSHNGPTFTGLEPAEFFGAWGVGRVGRAAFDGPIVRERGMIRVSGTCEGYERWGGGHVRRAIELSDQGSLLVRDTWSGASGYGRRSQFLVPADWILSRESESRLVFADTDDRQLIVTVQAGKVAEITTSQFHLYGPSLPQAATALVLQPDGDQLIVAIEPR